MKKFACFPYKSYKGQYYPIIKIQVKGSGIFFETEAYVDSGASTSIFLADFASCLGIDYTKGSFIPVYLHRVPVKLGRYSFSATIGFSSHLGADFNLLGQKDIFDRFKVCFDKSKKTISFYPY